MSTLTTNRSIATATQSIRGRLTILLATLGRQVNRGVAAAIARSERRAAMMTLRNLDDRELKDIGLYRGSIENALTHAAEARARKDVITFHRYAE